MSYSIDTPRVFRNRPCSPQGRFHFRNSIRAGFIRQPAASARQRAPARPRCAEWRPWLGFAVAPFSSSRPHRPARRRRTCQGCSWLSGHRYDSLRRLVIDGIMPDRGLWGLHVFACFIQKSGISAAVFENKIRTMQRHAPSIRSVTNKLPSVRCGRFHRAKNFPCRAGRKSGRHNGRHADGPASNSGHSFRGRNDRQ